MSFYFFPLPFPELSRKSSCILYGGLREHTLCMTPPPQGPQGLPNAPPADPGRTQDIAFRWWDPVMTYMQGFMRQKRHLGHISTHFWHGSRPEVIGPHTKCMTSMTSMTSTARVRARSRAPYIRKLFFLIFIFSKFQSYPAVHHIEGSS